MHENSKTEKLIPDHAKVERAKMRHLETAQVSLFRDLDSLPTLRNCSKVRNIKSKSNHFLDTVFVEKDYKKYHRISLEIFREDSVGKARAWLSAICDYFWTISPSLSRSRPGDEISFADVSEKKIFSLEIGDGKPKRDYGKFKRNSRIFFSLD